MDTVTLGLISALGGGVITFVFGLLKGRYEEAAARRKAMFEATLKRESEVIAAQIAFLESFTTDVWQYLFTAFKVSYAHAWEGAPEQKAAADEFAVLSWKLLTQIRATVSKSRRLVSDGTYHALLDLYHWLITFDDAISSGLMADPPVSAANWQGFHVRYFAESASVVDALIDRLAGELRLRADVSGAAAPAAALPESLREPARALEIPERVSARAAMRQ